MLIKVGNFVVIVVLIVDDVISKVCPVFLEFFTVVVIVIGGVITVVVTGAVSRVVCGVAV